MQLRRKLMISGDEASLSVVLTFTCLIAPSFCKGCIERNIVCVCLCLWGWRWRGVSICDPLLDVDLMVDQMMTTMLFLLYES